MVSWDEKNANVAALELLVEEMKDLNNILVHAKTKIQLRNNNNYNNSMITETMEDSESSKITTNGDVKSEIEHMNKKIEEGKLELENLIKIYNDGATTAVEYEEKGNEMKFSSTKKIPKKAENEKEPNKDGRGINEKSKRVTNCRRYPVIFSYEDFKGDNGDY